MTTLGGVGIYFQQETDGRVFVKSVHPGGPAHRNGQVKEGDEVQKVNGRDVKGLSLMDMRKLIIGEVGTEVELIFKRGTNSVAVRLARDVSTSKSQADESGADDASFSGGASGSERGGVAHPPSLHQDSNNNNAAGVGGVATITSPSHPQIVPSPSHARSASTPSFGGIGAAAAAAGPVGLDQQQQQQILYLQQQALLMQQQQQQQQQQQLLAAASNAGLINGVVAGASPSVAGIQHQQVGGDIEQQQNQQQQQQQQPTTYNIASWTETGPRFVEALQAVEALRRELNAKLDEAFERLYEHKYAVERQLQQEHERIEKDRMQLENERAHFINSSMQLHEEVRRQAAIRQAVTQATAPLAAAVHLAPAALPSIVGDSVLQLNVGGKVFATSVSTLRSQPGSLLDTLASGAYAVPRDSEGHLFIDRSPKYFELILEFLRTKQLTIPSLADDRRGLKVEADFFGIVPLSKMLDAFEHSASAAGVGASPNRWAAQPVLSQSLRSTSGAGHSYETPRRGLLATDFLQQ